MSGVLQFLWHYIGVVERSVSPPGEVAR